MGKTGTKISGLAKFQPLTIYPENPEWIFRANPARGIFRDANPVADLAKSRPLTVLSQKSRAGVVGKSCPLDFWDANPVMQIWRSPAH